MTTADLFGLVGAETAGRRTQALRFGWPDAHAVAGEHTDDGVRRTPGSSMTSSEEGAGAQARDGPR